jgi:hypothetical protein
MNLKDSIPFDLSDTSTCWKEPFSIKIGLRQRDVTIIESNFSFPSRENSGKSSIMLRIPRLDLHYLHFVSAPEFLLFGPLVPYRKPFFLERVKQCEKISPFSFRIESRPKGFFKSAKTSVLIFDPEDHGGLQRIEIEKPSSKFH